MTDPARVLWTPTEARQRAWRRPWESDDAGSSRGCPFHKLELYEIGEPPATGMLWSSSCRTF